VDVQAYMAERTPLVDAELERWLPAAGREPTALFAAMRHLVFPGGKRLRPALAMAAAEAVGRRPEVALPVATAVELIHTYSLIHDDLPCMDDDGLRRGRPTVHVAHGEAVAVLAGDALLTLAFECVVGDASVPDAVPPHVSVLAVRDLARAVGAAGLVGGQVDDLAFAIDGGTAVCSDEVRTVVESIHARKSAALIAAAVVCGARLAGADEARLEHLQKFGIEVGIAFQIADDLLDADEDGGCTLLAALGPDVARARAESLLEGALARIDDLAEPAETLRELARFAVRRSV